MNSPYGKLTLTTVAVLLFIAISMAQTASASVVSVGTCRQQYVIYVKIQTAINAVPPGSTVYVCPGTYKEQLLITKTLNLIGVTDTVNNHNAAVITSPTSGLAANTTSLFSSAPIAANVLVDGVSGVKLTNLIVDSAGNNINACAPELVGIFYRNSSGTLSHVETRNQWVGTSETDTNYNGCETGLGIFAQSGGGGSSTVTVLYASVRDYQKNGITGNESGTTLTVTNSYVMGQGPTNGAAENGIQIGFGAAGKLTGNTVTEDVWAPDTITDPGDAAAGILLYDAASSSVTVQSNTVANTQFGIALVTDTAGLDDGESVLSNSVLETHIFDAIDVCTNNNTIKTNRIFNSGESAIHLDASCGALDGGSSGDNNTVSNNTVNDANVGILKDLGLSGNTLSLNTFYTSVVNDPQGNARVQLPNKPVRP